jgi:hypothetical protein
MPPASLTSKFAGLREDQNMARDEEHLQLLAIFHYVVGGLAALFALLPGIYLIMGLFVVFASHALPGNGQLPPVFLGWLLVFLAGVFITIGLTVAALVLAAGRCLSRRRHYTFCLVMAGIECIFMPFGTVLGVFTIVVLVRESVKPLFGASPPRIVP